VGKNMSVKKLVAFFEDYYGERYTGSRLDVLLDYLSDATEGFLYSCAKVIPIRFTNTFGRVPDVAVIEKHYEEILENIPKPPALPAPNEYTALTPEETAERDRLMAELKKKVLQFRGPMAKPLAKVAGGEL